MINQQGQRLIKESEALKTMAYICPAGVPTIGYGHTAGITHQMVKDKFTISVDDAEAMFREDMEHWERDVRRALTREPNENQLAAMVSLAYNIGVGAFAKSTGCKAFNAGDDTAAANAFGLWNKITLPGATTKTVNKGLVARRARETALFLRPTMDEELTQALEPVSPMPQAVEAPVSLAASNINRSAVLTGGSATVAAVTSGVSAIGDLKDSFGRLGEWLIPVLLVVIILAAGWTIYERVKMRKTGVA